MGHWAYRVPDPPKPHVHDMPNYEFGMKTGDIWECVCTIQFEATVGLQKGGQVQYSVTWRALWPEDYK